MSFTSLRLPFAAGEAFRSSAQAGSSTHARPGSPTGSAATPVGNARSSLTGRRAVQPCRRTPRPLTPPHAERAAASAGFEAQIRRAAPGVRFRGRERAQFLRAEDVMHRHQQPAVRHPRLEVRAARRRSSAAAASLLSGSMSRRPGSPPRSGPPTSSWNLFSA